MDGWIVAGQVEGWMHEVILHCDGFTMEIRAVLGLEL